MAKHELFLVIDIGSTALHIAEFQSGDGSLILHAFDNLEYNEALSDENRRDVVTATVRRALASGKYRSKIANICISGQAAFMRFVKLPPVTDDESSVKKIVEFEAKQNVPFPIDEVVWDYQLIGNEDDEDELEVMFAVIKNDVVDALVQAVKSVGLKPRIVDFAPAALYNAARANYVGEDECAMLLDIGGKSTTLLFLEGGRLFARSIPIAGASISQQIAKEFNVPVSEAEMLKRRYGFVALGGAYEEPESEVAATISKIIRNVMTRLHGEINRTINIYRSQQKGSKPVKLFLAGGSSTMAFTEHFFSEKLRMEVSYFNAFSIVERAEGIDREELAQQAHLFPSLVGCALRSVHHCPVEISLSNEDKGDAGIRKRLPMILASCAVLTLAIGLCLVTNFSKKRQLDVATAKIQKDTKERTDLKRSIASSLSSEVDAKDAYQKTKDLLARREPWKRFFNAVQVAKPIDVWVSSIEVTSPPSQAEQQEAQETAGDAFDFFGGGGPATTAAAGPKETTKEDAEWFLIKGYSMVIPEQSIVNGEASGKFIRKIYNAEQILKFNEIYKRLSKNPQNANSLEALKAKLPFSEEANQIKTNTSLTIMFQDALRLSEEFNPQQTRVQKFKRDVRDGMKNLHSFEIRVQLNNPIRLKR